jgi:alpha-L-rhamnosidase
MLTDAIPYFEKYIKYLEGRINSGDPFDLADWMDANKGRLIPKEFVAEFYLLKALKITAIACEIAKMGSETREKFNQKKIEFIQKYIDDSGRCIINQQSSVAMMLELECGEYERTLKEQIIEVVWRDELRITCGMVGFQYLYDALARVGRADLAYKMITESAPGYKSWYDAGATTLWERWDRKNLGSHNHHMFSGVIAWFFRGLLGTSPKESAPGFERIDLRPCFVKELGSVSGEMKTVRGIIKAGWRYENGGFTYSVTLPSGIAAEFEGQRLVVGENTFFIKSSE